MQISQELIQQCIDQSRKAQFSLYKQCFSQLMSVCIRYKNNKEDAEEILNVGFMKILSNISKYNPKIPFEAWIKRIMINTIIDEFRKTKKHNELTEYSSFDNDQAFNDHIDYNEADKLFNSEELLIMIQNLPNLTAKVFNLYAIDGYSHKEISDMLGMTTGTSKWHVSTARKTLKQKITEKLNKQKIAS